MCADCQKNAEKMARLSQFLRENAPTIRSNHYAKIMIRAADDLDEMRRRYAERCRCDDATPADPGPPAVQAAASSADLAPPLATPTIAGRNRRSCST